MSDKMIKSRRKSARDWKLINRHRLEISRLRSSEQWIAHLPSTFNTLFVSRVNAWTRGIFNVIARRRLSANRGERMTRDLLACNDKRRWRYTRFRERNEAPSPEAHSWLGEDSAVSCRGQGPGSPLGRARHQTSSSLRYRGAKSRIKVPRIKRLEEHLTC